MGQKLWPNMLLFFVNHRQFGQMIKNHSFQKQKSEIDFLNFYIYGKLWIIPFLSMSQNLWGVFVCGQLWIVYSNINFEVLYFTQFSISFEKNKNIGCRLFTTTLQPLGLSFFNSMTKFLTILYFESLSTSFYLLFFPMCCTIPNDLKIFKHV